MAEHIIALEVIADTTQATKGASKLKAAFQDAVNPRPGAAAKATADKASGMGETKTARSIGAGGGTGSAASDFAAQAQGLGGLVHLYATFAANIFAVSAAFNALSKAMDVTNLVKGLDQIGASTGRNLGSLAKQMVAVADGAISMQQAMTSTAMASSGGMTNQAILRMTEVAKKASLALGRDMSDSMDRLTKGIVKTQPELLDELGIMTRMIPAQQEYARQIGKTIGSLTDFEKRQAFANAVLAEGEKKFGAINLDANPYSKISASIANLMQSGLELVNKVLGPLVNTLSQSPTGLALVLGGLASILVKQAMPAIGMFRENAKRMEAETHARVTNQVKEQQAAAIASDAIIAAKATRDYQVSEASAKAISELPKRFNKKIVGDEVRGLLAKSPYDLSDTEMATIKAKQDELAASTDKKHQDQATNIKKRYEGNLAVQKAALDAGYEATIVQIDKDEKAWTHSSMKKRELDKLTAKAASSSVLSKVADTAAIQGPAIAFKLLREETSKLDMNGLAKGVTLVKGSFSILTSAVSTAMNAFGVWAQVIGLVLAGISLLDGWLSTSAKTSEAFNGALDTLNSSFENIDRTLEVIRKKDLSEFLSVESTQAKANALNDLTGNLEDAVGKFTKLMSAQSGWDKFLDGFWDMFGKGSADKLSLGISKTVVDAFTLMEEGPAKKKAQDAINALTKDVTGKAVDMSTVKSFNEGIKDLDSSKIEQIGKITAKALSEASRSINNGASALTSFKTALTEVGKQATTISNSLVPKDDFSKLGVDLNAAASSMATALQDPINGLIALKELSGDLKTLSFLPPDLAVKLGSAKQEIDDVTNALAATKKELANATSKANATKDRLANAGGVASNIEKVNLRGSTQLQVRVEAEKTLAIETQGVEVAKAKVKWAEEAANTTRESFKGIAVDLAKAAYNNLALGLNKALAEASVTAAKGYLDTIKSAGGFTAQMDAELSKQQISIQIEDIKTRYSNTIALADLTLEVRKNTMIQERSAIASDIREQKGAKSESQVTRLDTLDKGIKEVELAQKIAKSGSAAIRNNARDASSKGADDTLRNAMGMLTDVVAQSFGKDSQLAKLFADMSNAELQKKAGAITDASNIKKQGLTNEGKNLTTSANDLANVQAINGMYNSQLQTSKELIAQAQLKNKYALEEEDITAKIAINQIALDKFKKDGNKDSKGLAEAERNAGALQTSLATTRLEKATQLGILESKSFQERKLGLQQLKDIQDEQEKSHRQYVLDIKTAEDTTSESKLNYYKEIGNITEAEYIKQSASIKAAAEERKFNEDILNIKKAQSKEQDAIQAKIDAAILARDSKAATEIGKGGSADSMTSRVESATANENAVIAQQTQLLADNKTKSNEIITSKTLQNTATAEAIVLQSSLNATLAEQKKTMEDMVSITMSLTTAFGEVGASIGKAMETVTKFAQTEEKYTAKKLAAQDELSKAKNDTQITAAQKKLAKLEDKHTEDQLDGIAEIAGATKKMFDEKTAAHKAFSAIEKVTAAASMALKVRSMAQDIASLASSIPAAIGQLFAQGGWAGFAGAAAFLAMLGSAGGGGSDFTMPGGITSADRQETQGTGMSWDANGNKVANGGGVFGDTSAKSESIQKSLDLIANTNVEGMSYQNNMVKLLTSINSGIEKLSVSLYSIQGISTGSGFGTQEGGSKSSSILWGLFGSSSTDTSIIDSGIVLKGTFLDLANAGKNANAVLNQFETVQTNTSSKGLLWGLFGGGSSTSINDNIKGLDQTVREQIGGIFTNTADLFVVQGKKLGAAEGLVMSTLATINVDKLASLRGLKGADLQKELNAVIGSIMDDTAKALFPKLDVFKKFGEGYAETVTRVIDTNEKIGQAFKQLGRPLAVLPEVASKATKQMADDIVNAQKKLDAAKSAYENSKTTTTTPGATDGAAAIVTTTYDPKLMQDVTQSELDLANARKTVDEANQGMTTNNLALTEALANAAGGLDKFLAISASFSDAFLTPVEKVAPKISAMHDEMDRLGVSTGITKSGLKDLVLNYKVTDAASAQYYVDLMTLANAYEINSQGIADVADKLGMSSSSIKSILSDAVKNAQSAEEARQLGTQGAADAIGSALQDALISGVAGIVTEAINSIVTNLVSGSTASAVNMVTGGAVAGANVAGGGAVAGANVATGGAVAGANVAEGGSAAAQNLVSGSAVAGGNISNTIQTAVAKVKSFVSTFTEVMKDPEVKSSLKELTAGFGEFAAASFTGSSAISSLTTSIGGSSKAATGAGGGGGAAGAANELASAWQSAADSIFKEVSRIRELMVGTGTAALDSAQAKFDAATALARGGDLEAAKSLPTLSQALLTTAESTTSTLLDLRKIQGATQSSLEQTGLGAVAQYGLKLPSYDVGTDRVMGDQIALIHDGEKITPKAYNTGSNDALLNAINVLTQEVTDLREIMQIAGIYTKKTSDTLTRVTLGGDSMQSTVIASVPVPIA